MSGQKLCPENYLESNNWELENEEKIYLWTQIDRTGHKKCPVVSLDSS